MSETAPVWPYELFSDLDRSSPVPLYHQIAERLQGAISSGAIVPGDRLESEMLIAGNMRISRPTIRRSIQELVDKGLLVRRRGVGTQVVQGQVTRPVELTSLYDDLKEASRVPSTRVLECVAIPAPAAIATQLGQAAGSEVLHLRRLRLVDGTPMAVLENYLPAEFADITSDDLIGRGLYDNLRSRGVSLKIANQKIGARRASADESGLLDVEAGSPLLTVDRTVLDRTGKPVEVGVHCYRPDLYSFSTTLVAR